VERAGTMIGNNIDWNATGAMVAAVAALLAVAWTYFSVIGSLKDDLASVAAAIRKELNDASDKLRKEFIDSHKEILNGQTDQGNRLVRMETKMEVFWGYVGTAMSSLIKQPIHFRKDELMDKLVPDQLPHLPENTVDELLELKEILKDELVTLRQVKDPKTLAYALALAYIDQILYDKGVLNK
jgi:hypothetical protein